jgi:hypothetical protein
MEQAMNGLVRHTLGVEDVAGYHDKVYLPFPRKSGQSLYGVESRFGKESRFIGLELPIAFADLPVGGMK